MASVRDVRDVRTTYDSRIKKRDRTNNAQPHSSGRLVLLQSDRETRLPFRGAQRSARRSRNLHDVCQIRKEISHRRFKSSINVK